MVFYAGVEVLGAAVVPGLIGGGVEDTLTVEEEPGLAAVEVGGGFGGFDLLAEGLEGGVELGGWGVAEGGGVVKGGPGGGVGARAEGGVLSGDDRHGVVVGAVVLDDAIDEDGEDGGEEDEVAGA